ncbi:hypothetical protein [Pseudalkalibacillus sp. NRS-1564]|uniref:hypothetical protein n=1 Tax=Pseudalkalibacillus sp. NRS-1564 TaxID=3233900 RepID=UPI003D287406
MNKQTIKNNRSKIMWSFINVALIASYIVLMFDSNTHNNLLATCLFTSYWFIRILRYGLNERAEGNQKRALYHLGLAIIVGMAIVVVGVIYLFGL